MIVEKMAKLLQRLSIEVGAEFVENCEIAEILYHAAIRYGQGYYLGLPLWYGLVKKKIERYETLLKEIWTASEKYLGTFSVKLLMERVVWDVSAEYREIELLQCNEDRISCAEIAASLKENPNLPVDDMFIPSLSVEN
ncbi:MAG: EAL domain-containing protein [Peptococcaceae bacterium]|nr:EAL domain-containing protein [Peptococcaceae bacterium]